jgi:transposase-like protein
MAGNTISVKFVVKPFQEAYVNQACKTGIDNWVISLIKENCGIRSIARLLKVASNTIMK